MTPAVKSLLKELDHTLEQAPSAWRSAALRGIVDLFVAGAETFSEDHVAIFDEVMCRLIKKNVDRTLLADLSNRLAPIANAPTQLVSTLAHHVDSAVHGPVLTHARALSDEALVDIANRDRIDPKLLNRIADRPHLSEAVTDVLLKRGNQLLQRKLIDNPNARISQSGFARLIIGINGNKPLAAAIAARDDVPPELRIWLDKTLGQ